MANICENRFYMRDFGETEDFVKSKEAINKYLETEVTGEITYEDDGVLEGWFDSKWCFPFEDFQNLIFGDVYFRCLSEEYGMDYVAMNIYNGGWEEEQTFEL